MAAITSAATGVFSATGSWTGGIVPVDGDTITIQSGHTITIDQNITIGIIGSDPGTPGITVASGGKLEALSTGSAAYTVIVRGDFTIGGTLEIGTVANPIPVGKEVVIKLNAYASATDGLRGLIVQAGSTLTMQGATKTYDRTLFASNNGGTCGTNGTTVTRNEGTGFTGKTGVITINGTDYTISSVTNDNTLVLTGSAGVQTTVAYVFQSDNNSLTTADTTGWADNDVIAIASTDRTNTHCERAVLNGAASGTALTLDGGEGSDGGLEWGHMGTSPLQAEVINLTRTILVTSNVTTVVGYVNIATTATVDIDWCEFSYLGENATNKRGIDISTTTGSCSINRCSLHDFEDGGIYTNGNWNNVTLSNNVLYNCTNTASVQGSVFLTATTGTTITVTANIVMRSGSIGFNVNDGGMATFTDNVSIGSAADGFRFSDTAPTALGDYSGCKAHSNASFGINFQGAGGQIIASATSWRNNGAGIAYSGMSRGCVVNTATVFGNSSYNINPNSCRKCVLRDCTANGGDVFVTIGGVYNAGQGTSTELLVEGGSFGATTGHSTADIYVAAQASQYAWVFRNVTLASATEINKSGWSIPSLADAGAFVSIQRKDQTDDVHITHTPYGTIEYDASTGNPTAPSIKLTPSSATYKLECVVALAKIADGGTKTISADVLETAAYNGLAPRLRYRRDAALGFAADATLDTHAMVDDTWETLTGATAAAQDDGAVEVYVDCDGTAGLVRIDNVVIA